MKTKIITSALVALLFVTPFFAQERTTVNATSSEISDNLDLRAIASIFGESEDLEDFENRLNDPKIQISNLDLNEDNQVDYLRVIESVEGNTHLIIVQSVLGQDTFQDVATIEVERDQNNRVQVQVVGDVYMYGANYIYEPVYVHTPIIYTSFWRTNYRPYSSVWYWGYYPTYYYAWNPYPVFRYRNNINVHINYNNHYNYVNVRHSQRAVALYSNRRSNYSERNTPNRSFAQRNANVKNRYELNQTRSIRNGGTRNETVSNNPRNATPRGNSVSPRENAAPRANNSVRTNSSSPRENAAPRANNSVRTNSSSPGENTTPRANTSVRTNSSSPRENATPRANNSVRTNPSSPRENAAPRATTQNRTESNRVNSETRSTPQRENTPVRNANSTENGRDRNSRR